MYAKFYYLQKQALQMLSLAIQHGDLTPAAHCEQCGKPAGDNPLDGHHHDYSKPLEVIWLCRSCHKFEHGSYGHRTPYKLQRVIDWINVHPESANMASRELARLIGVSHTLITTARKVMD